MSKKNELDDPLILTPKAIIDYTVCGLFYDCRHNRKETEIIDFATVRNDRFESTIKRVINHFFFKKQAGLTPSYRALLNKWEKLWFPKDMTAYDAAVERHTAAYDNLHTYSNLAVAALETFVETFSPEEIQVIMIDESFVIPVAPGIRLEGCFDVVLRIGDGYRVIKMISKRNRPIPHMFEFTALKMAFEHRNERPRDVTYHLYDVAASSSPFSSVPQPTRDDVQALKYWAVELRDNPTYVPRRGFTSYCKGCHFDETCRSFTFPEVDGV